MTRRDELNGPGAGGIGPDLTRRDLVALLAGAALFPARHPTLGNPPKPRPDRGSDGPLHYASLTDVARLIATRKVTPTALTRQMLDRITALDGKLQSYVAVMADHAMANARRAEQEIAAGRYRGPLHGVPIGIKDLCNMRGVATKAGTTVLGDPVAEFDATVVARLEAAGAIVLGKLVLCEGAFGPYHPGLQVPVNPWDPTRWSGVSSSGSGVATAAGLCFGSVGSDTGGSIRYPSAANGCVGLKPTYGRVSRYGVFPLAESMDHLGPMTRTVEDAAIMFEAMAGYDPNDPTSLSEPVPRVRAQLGRGVAGLRIGFDRRYSTEQVDPDIARGLESVLSVLSRLGAKVVDVTMPDLEAVGPAWFDLCIVEAAVANAKTFPSRAAEYGPGFRAMLELALKVTGLAYARAAAVRADLSGRIEKILAGVDCMVCPSMSVPARPKLKDPFGAEDDSSWDSVATNDVFTKPFNFSGSPTLSVPCGFAADGLPLSVQLVGRRSSEAMICRAGHTFERATQWHSRHPPV